MGVGKGLKREKPSLQQVLVQLSPFYWQGDASWGWNTKVSFWTGKFFWFGFLPLKNSFRFPYDRLPSHRSPLAAVGSSRERVRACMYDACIRNTSQRVMCNFTSAQALIRPFPSPNSIHKIHIPNSRPTGSGEMEAFCELFFDNLATLLGVTGSAVGHIGFGLIAAPWRSTPALYNTLIAVEWERIYYEARGHYDALPVLRPLFRRIVRVPSCFLAKPCRGVLGWRGN
jgi:hypothetical protein